MAKYLSRMGTAKAKNFIQIHKRNIIYFTICNIPDICNVFEPDGELIGVVANMHKQIRV